jgi:hypothetical protein
MRPAATAAFSSSRRPKNALSGVISEGLIPSWILWAMISTFSLEYGL